MDENKNIEPLASEMYSDLKQNNKFLKKLLVSVLIVATVIIVALVGALAATNIYHVHKWSQFDTYVVDSGEGGNANLVQGDNTGGIYNGTNSSQSPKEGTGEIEGLPD